MAAHIRYAVQPRDIPAVKAARLLHLSESEFRCALPSLIERGFPKPDETTGMFDRVAIDAWQSTRHPELCLTEPKKARDAKSVVNSRRGDGGWVR